MGDLQWVGSKWTKREKTKVGQMGVEGQDCKHLSSKEQKDFIGCDRKRIRRRKEKGPGSELSSDWYATRKRISCKWNSKLSDNIYLLLPVDSAISKAAKWHEVVLDGQVILKLQKFPASWRIGHGNGNGSKHSLLLHDVPVYEQKIWSKTNNDCDIIYTCCCQ